MIEDLGGPHSQLAMALVSRPERDRGSVEELAGSVDLPFVYTALDVIDEAATSSAVNHSSSVTTPWYSLPMPQRR